MLGAAIIVLVVSIAGAVAGLWFKVQQEKVAVDRLTMCPLDGPTAYTSVLIDGTDTFNAIQVADLHRYFSQLKSGLARHEQIAIYAPREMSSENLLQPLLKICNPGEARGISGITANPEAIQRKYDADFAGRIDSALGHGLDAVGANQSPIIEMIQAVVIDSFPIESTAPKRLVIVSDMLQNSDYYSHYSNEMTFEALRENVAFQHVIINLTGIDVDILYIGRRGSEKLQTNRHGLFWEAYIGHMNGNLRSIDRVGD